MGGEKSQKDLQGQATLGSPPHGRGKVLVVVRFRFGLGITPAWAGKSRSVPNPADNCEDHPRMGGEKE